MCLATCRTTSQMTFPWMRDDVRDHEHNSRYLHLLLAKMPHDLDSDSDWMRLCVAICRWNVRHWSSKCTRLCNRRRTTNGLSIAKHTTEHCVGISLNIPVRNSNSFLLSRFSAQSRTVRRCCETMFKYLNWNKNRKPRRGRSSKRVQLSPNRQSRRVERQRRNTNGSETSEWLNEWIYCERTNAPQCNWMNNGTNGENNNAFMHIAKYCTMNEWTDVICCAIAATSCWLPTLRHSARIDTDALRFRRTVSRLCATSRPNVCERHIAWIWI